MTESAHKQVFCHKGLAKKGKDRKRMRKIWLGLTCLLLSVWVLGTSVAATTDPSRSYVFDLTVNGETQVEVGIWEEITLRIVLRRVDDGRTGTYAMHSMQDEIIFDTRYFSLVTGSQQMAPGYDFNSHMMEDGVWQKVKVSRLIMPPSVVITEDEFQVAEFRLKVLTSMEEEAIISRNYKVNNFAGDSYLAASNDVYVTAKSFNFSNASVAFISWDEYNALPSGTKLLKLTAPIRLEEQACYLQGQVLYYSPLYSDPEEGLHVYLLGVNAGVAKEEVLAGIQILEGDNPVLSYNKDVNQDRRVDSTDVVLVYGFFKWLHLEDPDYAKVSMRKRLEADVNGDGVVDTTDATIVLSFIWAGRPGFQKP